MIPPGVLWQQAHDEHPTDPDSARIRYRELMREHGHLIPGKPTPLPCGWTPDNAPRPSASDPREAAP